MSVLLVTWKRTDLLPGCIEAIAAAGTTRAYEVVVVNNGGRSRAAAVEATVAPLGPLARVVHAPRNLGLAGGLRVARANARGRVLCTLQDDVVVEPGWLDFLLACLDADPWVGIAGSRVVGPDGVWGRKPCNEGWVADGTGRIVPRHPDVSSTRPVPVDTTSSASMAVRAAAWDASGEPDFALFPIGKTDTSLCLGVAGAGWSVVVEPRSVVRHRKAASTSMAHKRHAYPHNSALIERRYGARFTGRPTWDEPGASAAIEGLLAREHEARHGAPPPVAEPLAQDPARELRAAVRAARAGTVRLRRAGAAWWARKIVGTVLERTARAFRRLVHRG